MEREENYHHAIRRLFETSNWPTLSVRGPEAGIGSSKVDILINVSLPDENKFQLDDQIGIEIKTAVDAFETDTSNLEQVIDQAKTGKIDRLYVCTPETDHDDDTRLDIHPEVSQLINRLELGQSSIAFRGIKGTVRNSQSREISKTAYYVKLLNESKEKLFRELKRRGDLGTVKQNLEEYDSASIEGHSSTMRDQWIDPVLQEVGILRFDVETGNLRVQKEASYFDRTSDWTSRPKVTESDVAHAVWCHYVEQPDVDVAVEVELPSLVKIDDPNMVERFFGETSTRSAPRIDLLITTGDSMTGIEVKGPDPDWNRLFTEQVPTYHRASELDNILIAVPDDEIEVAKSHLGSVDLSVGLLKCSDPLGDSQIEQVL